VIATESNSSIWWIAVFLLTPVSIFLPNKKDGIGQVKDTPMAVIH
jgi:hypothetical protein